MGMLYLSLITFFSLGYAFIIFEKMVRLNKAATALLMGVGCWVIYFLAKHDGAFTPQVLDGPVAAVAQIIFFLLAVMAIVELIDSHHGFKIVTDAIYTSSKRKTLWFVLLISFFMSSVLDNLTSMIVMASLLRKMIPDKEERWLLGSCVVIAVNAGGAWTPIGDVTTTMMWIAGTITTLATIKMLFLPSFVCMLVTGGIVTCLIRGEREHAVAPHQVQPMEPGARRVFFGGLLALITIPVWKGVLGLPPFMGALIGLGVLWLITDLIHFRHGDLRCHLRVPHILGKIDTSGILFFLGILLAVASLTEAGILKDFARFLDKVLPTQTYVAVFIGLISSVIDNVPLVAATFGMYDLATYPPDDPLWQLIAYAAGTGGSILIIGSAAGVAFMGIEHVDFLWYLRRISWIALLSYFAGIITYLLL